MCILTCKDKKRIARIDRNLSKLVDRASFYFQIGMIVEQTRVSVSSIRYQRKVRGPIMASVKISDSQKFSASAKFLDKKGHEVPVDGAPQWLTDNGGLLELTPSEDGLSCEVSAVGPLGTALVTLKADADLGDGVVSLIGTLEVVVDHGQATVVEITTGEVSEQE